MSRVLRPLLGPSRWVEQFVLCSSSRKSFLWKTIPIVIVLSFFGFFKTFGLELVTQIHVVWKCFNKLKDKQFGRKVFSFPLFFYFKVMLWQSLMVNNSNPCMGSISSFNNPWQPSASKLALGFRGRVGGCGAAGVRDS